MEPSGADKGFFQTPPTLPNQVHDDDSYKRCFKRAYLVGLTVGQWWDRHTG